MDPTANEFVPKGRARPQQTQPVTPPMGGSPHGPPSGAGFGGRPSGSGSGYSTYGSGGPHPHHGHHHHGHHHHHHGHHHHHHGHHYQGGARGYGSSGSGYGSGYGGGGGGGGGSQHYDPAPGPNRPPAYTSAPQTPLSPGGSSKLRAGASSFVPGVPRKSPGPEDSQEEPKVQSPLTAASMAKLSAGATPYTPTRRTPASPTAKGGAFPAAPPRSETSTRDSPVPQSDGGVKPLASDTTATAGTPMSPLSPNYGGAADTFATSKLPVPDAPKAAEEVKLHSTWTLSADSHPINIGAGGFGPATTGDYCPTTLKNVSTLESFWRLWRSLKPPSQQVPSFTLHFFRRPISPTWEDTRNRAGGIISIPLWDRDRMSLQDRVAVIDDAWWLATMALAGESLPNALTMNGAVLKIRQRSTLLQIWTGTSDQKLLAETAAGLRGVLKERLSASKEISLDELEFHKHASADTSKPQSPLVARPAKGKGKATKREADYKL